MKRRHVFEFEDQAWFPGWLRDGMTRILVVFSRALGATDALGRLVGRAAEEQRVDAVVDLGSGSGGVMPEVVASLRGGGADLHLTMCDLYPNQDAIRAFNREGGPAHLRYLPEPVDARDLRSAPPGLKVMANSFHHMRPEDAAAILSSAQSARQPLLIYELADNRIPFPLWCLGLVVGLPLVALSALALTPFVRPLSARQLLFTYVVPLLPLAYAWDGQASMPRIYGLDDLEVLLARLDDSSDYVWEKGEAPTDRGRSVGIYLLGMPVRAPRASGGPAA
ncbi:MAG: hypothetical protein AAGB93_19575 [Planctomycetota bacterium]